MSAWQHSSLDPNLANLVKSASIGTMLVIDHLVAENSLAQDLEILLYFRFARGVILGHGREQFFFQHSNQFVAFSLRMFRGIESVGQTLSDGRLHILEVGLVKFRWSHLALRLADLAAQLLNRGTNLFDFRVREFNR